MESLSESNYICTECGEEFWLEVELLEHKIVHDGEYHYADGANRELQTTLLSKESMNKSMDTIHDNGANVSEILGKKRKGSATVKGRGKLKSNGIETRVDKSVIEKTKPRKGNGTLKNTETINEKANDSGSVGNENPGTAEKMKSKTERGKLKKVREIVKGVAEVDNELFDKKRHMLQIGRFRDKTGLGTGELPYKCNICDESFKRFKGLSEHRKVVHYKQRPRGSFKSEERGNNKPCESLKPAVPQTVTLDLSSQYLKYDKKTTTPTAGDKLNLQDNTQLIVRVNRSNSDSKQLRIINRISSQKQTIVLPVEKQSLVKNTVLMTVAYPVEKNVIETNVVQTNARINPSYKCEHCSKTFKYTTSLKNHLKKHSGLKPFKCNDCAKAFLWPSDLDRHMKSHSEIRPLKCDLCDKSFKVMKGLREHKRVHSEETPFSCEVCGQAFKRQCNLAQHMFHHEMNVLSCHVCEKVFMNKYRFKAHLVKHDRKKIFQCNKCDKAYVFKYDLHSHMKIHSEERPHQCFECGKSFKLATILKRHMLIHSREESYVCDECGKPFLTYSAFTEHKMIKRHGKRLYTCKTCKKAFTYRCELHKHMLLHSGLSSNQCNVCGKKFYQMSSLRLHIKVHKKEVSNLDEVSNISQDSNNLNKEVGGSPMENVLLA